MAAEKTMANISLVLGIGHQGPSVTRAQNLLRAKGYTVADDAGLFGPSTEEAVRQFQTVAGLRVDGTVSAEVWRALEHDPAKEAAAIAAMKAASSQNPPMTTQPAPSAMKAETQVDKMAGEKKPGSKPGPTLVPAQQLQAAPTPAGLPWGKILTFGGLALLGYGVYKAWSPEPSSFDAYEDDYGLAPMTDDPDGDDGAGDVDVPVPSLGAIETDIVPFGGGPALKRGPGGKFLPRRGKKIAMGS